MNDNQIRERIAGRGQAVLLLDLDAEERRTRSPEFLMAFWENIQFAATIALGKLGVKPERKPQPVVPMDDAETKQFEASTIPFGKWVNTRVDVVLREAPDYLDWLTRATEEDHWKADLRRWLARGDVQECLPGGDDE